ncbi:MAG: HEAT repeat domain-containing protein [Myxococcales bacterium]|nr:HEAT repeat domain-containing protein [Myxococcales bacterium]MDH5306980.1 HEAT repeat domain-containing protein [Myxococcales bacterium]MDH5566855.1 HEAT repeat domain-containing protein [Myxococcales bacterium]
MTHPIVERLRSDDPEQRRSACADAARDPSAALFVEALCERLADPVHGVASAASRALAQLAPRDAQVRRGLDRALRGEEPMRRWRAALTYPRFEPPSLKLLPVLIDASGAPDRHVRWATTKLLVDLGRLQPEVLPVLLERSHADPRPVARRMLVHALRGLAPDRSETARALLAATQDRDAAVRRAALAGLAALLDPPAEVLERLCETLRGDDDAASRRIAATALGALGARNAARVPPAAATALRSAARTAGDPDLRRAAARALDRIGGAA